MPSALASWLRSRSTDDLARIIGRRRDVLAGTPIVDIDELARRLLGEGSTLAALSTVTLPQAQVIEAVAGLGGSGVTIGELAEVLGRPPGDPDVAATLADLAELAFVWPDESGGLRMADLLREQIEFPLGLGPPAGWLLSRVESPRLVGVARAWGLPAAEPRELARAVAAVLADASRVCGVVGDAPEATRALLVRAAHGRPTVDLPGRPEPPVAWALDRGLLVADGWRRATMPREVSLALRGRGWRAPFDPRPPALDVVLAPAAAVAREAAAAGTLAVWRFDSLLHAAEREPLAVLRSGGVGARELRRVAAVAGEDVRLWVELGSAAGLLGVAGETVAPTAAYDGWAASTPAERLATLVTAWLTLPTVPTAATRPGGEPQLAALMPDLSWASVLDARPGLLRLLGALPPGRGAAAAVPRADGSPTDAEAVAAALRWHQPTLLPAPDPPEPPDPLVAATLREARLLGLVAHGALSPLGRALVEAPETVVEVAAGLLPDTVAEASFRGDLTAHVPGLPTAPLATLLDASASRIAGPPADRATSGGAATRFPLAPGGPASRGAEVRGGQGPPAADASGRAASPVPAAGAGSASQGLLAGAGSASVEPAAGAGSASEAGPASPAPPAGAGSASVEPGEGAVAVWRFTPESVRAALDAGFSGATLREALKIVAGDGGLPPALDALVDEAARRHGLVRVRAVGCVVHTVSAELATELLTARGLRGLGLTALAPTVLTSARPADETLAELRAAGYAPAAEDPSGARSIGRAVRKRGAPKRRHPRIPTARPAPSAADLAALAGRLLEAASTSGTEPSRPRLVPAGGGVDTGLSTGDGSGADRGPARGSRGGYAALWSAGGGAGAAYPDDGDGGDLDETPAGRPVLWLVPGLAPDDGDDGGPYRRGDTGPAAREAAAAAVRRHTPQLDPYERDLLVDAIVVGGRVKIDYTSAAGEFSTRVIEPMELDGKRLVAWCHLREDERVFGLHRIERVTPATS